MGSSHLQFDKKMRGLARKHKKLARGHAVTVMRADGLMEMRVRRRTNPVLRPLVLFAIGFFCFKAFLIVSLGEDTYDRSLAKLEGGTVFESAGAWVMQNDIVTTKVVEAMRVLSAPG